MDEKLCVKLFLFVLNLLFFIISSAIFALTLWIRFDLDLKEWVMEINFYQFWTGAYVLMAASIFVIIIAFIGCFGAIGEYQVLLIVSVVVHALCVVLQLSGAAYLLINGTQTSTVLTDALRDIFRHLIWTFDTNLQNRHIMKNIQEYIGCCGADGPNDWFQAGSSPPIECRDPITGHDYKEGCVERFAEWLEKMSGSSSGLALFLCILQVASILLSLKMWKILQREKDAKAGVHYSCPSKQVTYIS